MTNFPEDIDDDSTIIPVNDNITEIGGLAINQLKDAVIAIEQNIGINANGITNSISDRLNVSFFPDGYLKPSTLTSLGLVTLPITQNQIAPFAAIPESKLKLDHATQDLFNYITNLSTGVNTALGWINATGIKLEPHISGALYRHTLSQINVTSDINQFLDNKFRVPRDNSQSFNLINDINNEFLAHQWADGSPFGTIGNVITNNGSSYPSNYGHTASGIFLNTSRFTTIPETADDLQQFAQYIDSASIFLLGTRIQNLYSNGISKESRSSSLSLDGYGSPVIPMTPAIAYLKNLGTAGAPFDDINTGDDIIEFKPSAINSNNNSFDEQFALVKIGDIVRINYGTIEVQFVIKEKKYIQNSGNKKYLIRIAGKNLFYAPFAIARIDRPLVNANKYGVLAVASANSNVSTIPSSLIVGSPRGAQALGIGFNADQFDNLHYLLYLALYPTGSPSDGYLILPGIDITGNQGTTPGLYTIDSIVQSTNDALRAPGFNYRFIAFQYNGEFGIMLADSYNNAGFSILSGVVNAGGTYDSTATNLNFQKNVIDVFAPINVTNGSPMDPLGFGISNANIASPPYQASYGSPEAAQLPTKLFLPLRRNNYYVNGIEQEKLTLDVGQVLDGYGDGYWVGTLNAQLVIPGPSPVGRVQNTYRIPLDLSTSQLKIGKTLVVQKINGNFPVDFGRFIIQDITFVCSTSTYTDITVYDAVHGTGVSPFSALAIGQEVSIYFNSDSVAFNAENASDFTSVSPFKRYLELYIDQNAYTFTQERGRFYAGNSSPLLINGSVPLNNYSELTKINLVKISSKLRGYQFGSVNKITLNIIDLDNSTGIYDGYLSSWDGTNAATNQGSTIFGKIGEITRFYDESNVDYIDVIFDINTSISNFTNKQLDIQLFPTLANDNEEMLLSSFQYNNVTNVINYVKDQRQFGNTSIKDISTSALEFLSLPERLLFGNGVIRGFDLEITSNPNAGQIYLTGGTALVNGNFVQLNNETITIPLIKENPNFNINWALCINDKGKYQPIPLLDFDSVLSTPSNINRIFTAFNLINGNTYNIDASTFSNILNIRKDLVPLYIVSSTTTFAVGATPPSINLVITDARKYINNTDTNLPLILTSSQSQGNFRTPAAIFNWLKYNNTFNGNAIVRGAGADVSGGIINTALILNFTNNVVIDGQNNANLTFNAPVGFGSNTTLKNMNLTFNGAGSGSIPAVYALSNVSNFTIDNCNIVINISSHISSTNNIVFNFVNGKNINILNSSITVNYNPLLTAPVTLTDITAYADIFRFNGGSNILINNTQITGNWVLNPGVNIPGNIMTVLSCNNVTVKDSGFFGNFNRGIANNRSNSLHITNTSFSSTYCPYPNSSNSPDLGFSYQSLVNTGQGYVYANVDTTLDDLIVDNCSFNCLASTSFTDGYQANRFSFINYELSTPSAVLKNIKITNNKFFGNFANSVDDLRSSIAIINICPANTLSTANSTVQPTVFNANISNNDCNRNQSIIMTSKTYNLGDGYFNMYYPGLAAVGCNISNNICGHIGYWISSATKFINIIPNINSSSDKATGLTIENNICHDITNTDHNGLYFLVSAIQNIGGIVHDYSKYPSGNVTITNNRSNWIHVGIAFEENSSLFILNNSLSAYDANYLLNLNDFTLFGIGGYGGVSPGYAIFVGSNSYKSFAFVNPGNSNDSAVQIVGNVTSPGYWVQSGSTTIVIYNYLNGYIFSQPSANIHQNILKGTATHSNPLIYVSGTSNFITYNKIYRQSQSVGAYIGFPTSSLDGGSSVGLGANTNGFVVDNIFDSPFIDAAQTSTATYSLPTSILTSTPPAISPVWRVERNRNQTGTVTIFPSSGQIGLHASGTFDPVVSGKVGTNSLVQARTVITFNYADTGVNQFVDWLVSLSGTIPLNCSLVSAAVSILATSAISTASYNTSTMYFTDGPAGFPQLSATTSITLTTLAQTLSNSALSWSTSTLDSNRGGFITVEMGITNGSSTVISCSAMSIVYRWQ